MARMVEINVPYAMKRRALDAVWAMGARADQVSGPKGFLKLRVEVPAGENYAKWKRAVEATVRAAR